MLRQMTILQRRSQNKDLKKNTQQHMTFDICIRYFLITKKVFISTFYLCIFLNLYIFFIFLLFWQTAKRLLLNDIKPKDYWHSRFWLSSGGPQNVGKVQGSSRELVGRFGFTLDYACIHPERMMVDLGSVWLRVCFSCFKKCFAPRLREVFLSVFIFFLFFP